MPTHPHELASRLPGRALFFSFARSVRILLAMLMTLWAQKESAIAQTFGAPCATPPCWDGYRDLKGCEIQEVISNTLPVSSCGHQELAPAVLIPRGPYRGWVMLFHWKPTAEDCDVGVTEAFLFDPANLNLTHKLVATLPARIHSAGMTWDGVGNLVVVAAESNPGPDLRQAWRFRPNLLDPQPVYCIPSFPGCTCAPAMIDGNVWEAIDDMSIEHAFPGIATLQKESITTNSGGSTPGGGTFVFAGIDAIGGPDVEFWQTLNRGAVNWNATQVPDDPVLIDPNHIVPSNHEEYSRHSLFGVLPSVHLWTDPRSVQLCSIFDSVENKNYARNLLVALSGWDNTGSPPASCWVIRPRYASAHPQLPDWQLWTAPSYDTIHGLSTETAGVLLHTLAANPPFSNGRNRMFLFGGHRIPPAPTYPSNREFVPSRNPAGLTASWVDVATNLPRYDGVATALPDGSILLSCGNPGTPFTAPTPPELFVPGLAGTSGAGTLTTMPAAPTPIGQSHPFWRAATASAVLLPDGRVLVAGGDGLGPGVPDPRFSFEVFRPAYFALNRPGLVGVGTPSGPASDIAFGSAFTIDVAHAIGEPILKLVLLRPAATARGFDWDQRYVELGRDPEVPGVWDSTGTIETIQMLGLADDLGPPGYYMLFAVSQVTPQGGQVSLAPSNGMFVRFY